MFSGPDYVVLAFKVSSVIIIYIFKRPGMQTQCPLGNPIIVDNFASLFKCSVWVGLRKILNICGRAYRDPV